MANNEKDTEQKKSDAAQSEKSPDVKKPARSRRKKTDALQVKESSEAKKTVKSERQKTDSIQAEVQTDNPVDLKKLAKSKNTKAAAIQTDDKPPETKKIVPEQKKSDTPKSAEISSDVKKVVESEKKISDAPKHEETPSDTKKVAESDNRTKTNITKIFIFAVVLMTFCMIGMAMSLRPQVSVLEKRKLAEFPEITFVGVWNGTFFKELDIWYSDTYPMREEMIAADKKVENAYGVRSEQIIEGKGDLGKKGDPVKPSNDEPEENLPDGTVRTIGEVRGPIYIANNCGYELYTFLEDTNTEFAQTMNNIYSRFKGIVDIYVMMVPTGAGVMLDKSVLDYLGTSDELAAVQFDYAKMDPGIKKVEVVSTLRRHNAEYLYFHTDHHWTALGAYYAYREFCKVKGIEPHDIKDYEKRELHGFLGSFYTESDQSPEIAANPDTVIAYVPKGTNKMTMVTEDNEKVEFNVINDMSESSPSEYYLTFVMGDAALCYTHNETISDGSAVLVIKDSHGNAFIPWLVDHYEYVYWIDPRYTKNTISQMIRDYGIKDVIYEVGIYGASNPYMYGKYDQIGW